jgi:hypothetical protein
MSYAQEKLYEATLCLISVVHQFEFSSTEPIPPIRHRSDDHD